MKTSSLKLATAATALLLAGQTFAALPLTATRSNNFTFTVDNTDVPLNDAGATALTFNTTANNQKVAISYNAECSYMSSTGLWISADILVDGQNVAPSSGAMCTALSDQFNFWTKAVVNGVYTVPKAGTHVIQVRGRLAGVGKGWLGDTSLIVWR